MKIRIGKHTLVKAYSVEQVEGLNKAGKKDLAKLVKKQIVDKKGHSKQVWVKPEITIVNYTFKDFLKKVDKTPEEVLRDTIFSNQEYIDTPGDFYARPEARSSRDIEEHYSSNMGDDELDKLRDFYNKNKNSEIMKKFMKGK